MNNSPLHLQMLEASLIITDYVPGDSLCNYEIYLKEIINASAWFSQHFSIPFCSPENESHGECDFYSSDYGLDFKLIASKTALQARSIHSLQIIQIIKGVYEYCEPKKKGSMRVTRFPQALRGQTIEELLAIRNKATKKQGIENDILNYFETLETEKNLLLFFPYLFSFEKTTDIISDIQSIIASCNEDFGISLKYRSALFPTLDTFFVFLYDYYFVLCKWEDSQLIFLEGIPVEESDTFMHLIWEYCDGSILVQKYDVILRMLQERKSKEDVVKEIDEETHMLRHILPTNDKI